MKFKLFLVLGFVMLAVRAENEYTPETILADYEAAIKVGNADEAYYWSKKFANLNNNIIKHHSYDTIKVQIKEVQALKAQPNQKKSVQKKKSSRSIKSVKDIIRKLARK